ncbi:hypothetical protein, partial [Vibrio cholerae]|uniref:hypothetical protein n=1 Tax=Vibrio cholerae TaxID=666 RepID=UPI001E30654D
KLKHSNRNHRGSMGLETLRVTVPLEAFVMCINSKLKLASSKHATRYFMTNHKANNSNTYEN